MSTVQEPTVAIVVTPVAATEVLRFMEAEGVPVEKGGLRVSVQPGGCSGFKYGLLIEDQAADDDEREHDPEREAELRAILADQGIEQPLAFDALRPQRLAQDRLAGRGPAH